VASHAKWAGFFASTVAGCKVLPTAFVTPINYIISHIAHMPSYFQLRVEYLLSCLRTNFYYRGFNVLFPLVCKF
jgi:hypothetical protein